MIPDLCIRAIFLNCKDRRDEKFLINQRTELILIEIQLLLCNNHIMKIGLCGNIELESIALLLDSYMPENEIVFGRQNCYEEELQNRIGDLRNLDLCIIALDWRKLIPELATCSPGELQKVSDIIRERIANIKSTIEKFRSSENSRILIFSPVGDPYSSSGFIDRLLPAACFEINSFLQQSFNTLCRSITDLYPLDIDALSSRIGKDHAFDPRTEYLIGQPFSSEMIDSICRCIHSVCLQLKKYPLKCLVLDLDNTLWGGIVGESGVENILLDDSGPGKAYRDFQSEILKLYKQGIILAICSKNNTCDAMEVLESHEKMLIRPDMISCYRINWDDKPKNILQISEELRIGLDSMMFIDDNPSEREAVRKALPEVEVLEMPENPAFFALALKRCTRFWPVEITSDDSRKGEFFQKELLRKRSQELAANLEDFLYKSEIKAKILSVDQSSLPRVVQLFNKTNQFNLTTRRYSLSELESLRNEAGNHLFCMELSDKFGEYGIIAAALVRGETIDSFVLSCRVFGKQVERAFLLRILEFMKKSGIKEAEGVYIPTLKNSMVKDFFKNNGFSQKSKEGDLTVWEIDLQSDLQKIPAWISIQPVSDEIP